MAKSHQAYIDCVFKLLNGLNTMHYVYHCITVGILTIGCCEFESRSGEVYWIQHYMIKFVSDLQQVSGFQQVLRFPLHLNWQPRYTEIFLKKALNTINQTNHYKKAKAWFSSTVLLRQYFPCPKFRVWISIWA